ncbi:MAG: pore-forming ESAT-6 family protein [Eubacteriales bacterium]|nr:pore-forming ESAT-6 family protein [Lachnospiraceae bacterium]MDO5127933.1 pore-forming ESAT-6 family protein [Eubacteriales bacterium]
MADGIKISLGEVTATAATIRTLNTAMDTNLQDIKKKMNDLSSTWQSDGAETIRTNFNNMSASFEEYKKIVESYAAFLDKTVESYNTTENTINSNASSFA